MWSNFVCGLICYAKIFSGSKDINIFKITSLIPMKCLKRENPWCLTVHGFGMGMCTSGIGELISDFPNLKKMNILSSNRTSLLSIWTGHSPIKVKFFVWELSYNNINTQDNLQHRCPWYTLYLICCPICKKNSELVMHLFIQCPFALAFWDFIIESFNWSVPRL